MFSFLNSAFEVVSIARVISGYCDCGVIGQNRFTSFGSTFSGGIQTCRTTMQGTWIVNRDAGWNRPWHWTILFIFKYSNTNTQNLLYTENLSPKHSENSLEPPTTPIRYDTTLKHPQKSTNRNTAEHMKRHGHTNSNDSKKNHGPYNTQ